MVRRFVITAAPVAVIMLSLPAFAQENGGTAEEAKAMLMRAVSAVKADKVKALAMFNKGDGGFRDRDLYVFCVNVSDGMIVAMGNPHLAPALGMDIRLAHNPSGRAFGAEIYAAMQKPEGQVTAVSYITPKPSGDDTLAAKISFVTSAGDDLGCAVGYYK